MGYSPAVFDTGKKNAVSFETSTNTAQSLKEIQSERTNSYNQIIMNANPIYKNFHDHSYVTTANQICTVYQEKTFLFSFCKLNLGLETQVDFFQLMHQLGKKNYKHTAATAWLTSL